MTKIDISVFKTLSWRLAAVAGLKTILHHCPRLHKAVRRQDHNPRLHKARRRDHNPGLCYLLPADTLAPDFNKVFAAAGARLRRSQKTERRQEQRQQEPGLQRGPKGVQKAQRIAPGRSSPRKKLRRVGAPVPHVEPAVAGREGRLCRSPGCQPGSQLGRSLLGSPGKQGSPGKRGKLGNAGLERPIESAGRLDPDLNRL
jgi:hypothetical protein